MSASGREPGTLGSKIPVEALDEMRLARIERSVLGALEQTTSKEPARRRWDWAWPAAFAACAVALVVILVRDGGATRVAPQAMAFATGAAPSSVVVGRARIEVAAHTRVAVRELAVSSVRVSLSEGQVYCDVEKYPHRPAFVVDAGEVSVTVVGTAFSVARSGDEVAVVVERGIVGVRRGDEDVRLEAGQRWATPGWKSPDADTVVAAVEAGGSADVEPALPSESSEPKPSVSNASRDPEAVAKKSAPKKVAAPARDSEAAAGAFSPFRAPGGLDPIMTAPTGTQIEVEAFYRSLSLARGDSSKSSYALYSLAYWQLYRMRNPRAALQSADLYERRFRRTEHAESMLWVRMAALCALELDSRCRAAAHSYMRRYPGGRFARHVKDVINRQR